MTLSHRVLSQMLTAGWLGAAGLLVLDMGTQGATAVPAHDPVAPNAAPWAPSSVDANPPEERLALALLGTLASTDPSLSRATLLDLERDARLVVGVGDQIRDRALVVGIERDRVRLRENGVDHELIRDGARRSSVSTHDDFARLNAEFDGVHVFPAYEADRMVGLEFGLIQYGTRFAEIGLQTGDVITELDGRTVDSPAMSAQVLAALSEADAFHAVGRGADGYARVWSAPSDR